jgi:hypothetical protein
MIKKLLPVFLFALFLFSCKKDDISPLTGEWTQAVKVAQGTMVSTLRFTDQHRYSLESYILSPDKHIIIQTTPLSGRYSVKSSGITFRVDGKKFDWAIGGRVQNEILTIKDALDKSKLTFVRELMYAKNN